MKINEKSAHFIGIGGAGMSGLAKIMLEYGYRVSGSDIKNSSVVERLSRLGVLTYIGHSEEHIPAETDLVVVSSAIPENNPELLEARRRGLKIISRGEMLARLMEGFKGIVVAGAHGKTTITSMIAMCLEKCGYEPTVAVGGELNDIGGNAKLGRGEYFVAEGDESDGSFLRLKPYIGVVSNVENDHLDYYGTFENIASAFEKFIAGVQRDGFAVLCADDPFLREIALNSSCRVVTYGWHPSADYSIGHHSFHGYSSLCEIFFRKKKLGTLELKVPGRHNMVNALAAVAVSRIVGIDFQDAAKALGNFKGASRRFQLLGNFKGAMVVDDYAHHPTEIAATLRAAVQGKPRRIIAVFQPHRYTRTKYLHEEFGKVFGDAHLVIVNEIYAAGEKPIPGVSGGLIAEEIKKYSNENVIYIPGREETVEYLDKIVKEGDLILTIGAGDVWKIGAELVNKSVIAGG
ncbi:MAG: UDP-N-acetylmuramate--L-alanine ligase [Clostridia bacterium]|nr:UDP-N-acetylmuramate--L-alanine ligase [Clostridia bacterium]